ncbi:hypothetical protein AB0L57_13095 [Nocardia sp. NPDC052254]|uniref:hypothetical protein n=1 Tax=Nocardia sp. NPDC052254 TaxID=3155681 RepID=UPI00343488A7
MVHLVDSGAGWDLGVLPPVTRMLLRADGSTTRLLEALLGESLSLNIIEQSWGTAAPLPARLRDVLACDGDDRIVRRSSMLQLGDARPVSRNQVTVACRDRELTAILTDDRVPIGHGLDASGRHLGRTLLATGWARWPVDEPARDDEIDCVYKEYVLTDESRNAIAHIHERFNPIHVPSAAAR